MIDAQFTYFDAAVLGIMALSCLFAFFRGFVKEILSLGAWIGAGIITVYFMKDVTKLVLPHVKDPVVAGGMSALGLYVVALIFFSIVNGLISRLMKDSSDIGILDNMLGLFFGAFRAAFIISLGYFMMMVVISDKNAPEWLDKAITRPYAERGAILLGKAAPDYLVKLTSLQERILEEKKGDIADYVEQNDPDAEGERESIRTRNLDTFINNLNREEN